MGWLDDLRCERRQAIEEVLLGAQRLADQVGRGLYTILLLPILYGVWHTKEGGGEGVVHCPIVVQ